MIEIRKKGWLVRLRLTAYVLPCIPCIASMLFIPYPIFISYPEAADPEEAGPPYIEEP